jgi:hypothetical protein
MTDSSQQNAAGKGLSDNERSAAIVAGAVFVFSIIYWWEQIQSVLELLELAYG